MSEYAFDVKLWAVVRLEADDREEALKRVREALDCLDLTNVEMELGVRLTEASLLEEPVDFEE